MRLLHSVPLHYWPPRLAVAADPKFRDDPIMNSPAGQKSLAVVNEGISSGVFALEETGTPVLKVGTILQDGDLSAALQRVLLKGQSPQDSLRQLSMQINATK
jgi:hypothetical protein